MKFKICYYEFYYIEEVYLFNHLKTYLFFDLYLKTKENFCDFYFIFIQLVCLSF